MRLIERTARWVAPKTFNLLPVWYPEHARRTLFYKGDWTQPLTNTNKQTGVTVHKPEGNTHANMALTRALGLRSKGRPNWSCCHIWGVDDPTYQQANVVVQDRRFYSCVANMVLLPSPLKTFTDVLPSVKAMLRICARNLYGWQCDHASMTPVNAALNDWQNWDDYPQSWPREAGARHPDGVMPINAEIRNSALKRWRNIQKDIESSGPHYPRDDVLKALDYWKIDIDQSLACAR